MMENADPAQKLYNRMRLWEFSDRYVVEPTDGSSSSSLSISRFDGSMNLIDDVVQCSSRHVHKIWTIFGVVGMLKLLAGSYLLVITERGYVGSYLGYHVFKIMSMKVFPCDRSLKISPEAQKKTEIKLSRLLNVAERSPGLYFSYDVNITLSAQRLHDLGEESKLLPLWRQADPQFLWNNYMLEVLIDKKLDPYLLPVMQGSILFNVHDFSPSHEKIILSSLNYLSGFQIIQSTIGKDIIDVTLIARRCTRRTGTRMWRRGADSDGFVANFVETEQIIQLNGCTASFIQVRGSVPLFWDQIVDLTYRPKFDIVKLEEIPQVVERHFLDLRKKYGNVLAVDLLNQHGDEGRLSEKFGNAMKYIASDDVRYRQFDFHRICGYVHFERLSILYYQIQNFLVSKNRYLLLNEKGEKVEGQVGVLRTNSIDCLDRTNVAQSIIARKILESQLRRLGVFNDQETISRHPNFDQSLKNLWANHGDDISIQYSGTPALKEDFVRCGQRTPQGLMKDGWNALMRYYLNNFCDGTKQDAIDLLQGHYTVSVRKKQVGVEAIVPFPVAFSLIMIGFFFATVSLSRARYDLSNILFSIMWASMSFGIAAYTRANGHVFCNRPLLHQPRH